MNLSCSQFYKIGKIWRRRVEIEAAGSCLRDARPHLVQVLCAHIADTAQVLSHIPPHHLKQVRQQRRKCCVLTCSCIVLLCRHVRHASQEGDLLIHDINPSQR